MDDLNSLLDGFPEPTLAAWEALRDAQLKGRPYAALTSTTEDGIALPPLVRGAAPAPVSGARAGRILFGTRTFETDPPEADEARAAIEAGYDRVLVGVVGEDFEDARDVDFGRVLRALPKGRTLIETRDPLDTQHALAHAAAKAPDLRVVADLGDYGEALCTWLATPAQSLAVLLAHGAWMLRGCPDPSRFAHPGKIRVAATPERIARHVALQVFVGTRVVEHVAALRAARLTWGKVLAAFGVTGDAARAYVVAEPTCEEWSVCDPETNRIRRALQGFAAIAGGADLLLVAPHDGPRPLFTGDAAALRELNPYRVLIEEAFADRVDDVMAGAQAVEALTDGIARRAWELFQAIEAAGGFADAFMDDRIDEIIGLDSTLTARGRRVAHRERVIVGVSRFADPPVEFVSDEDEDLDTDEEEDEDEFLDLGDIDAMEDTGVFTDAVTDAVTEDPRHRAAEPFERLHLLAGELAEHGGRPRALLLPIGPAALRRARADFAADALRAAGFDVVDPHELPDAAAAQPCLAEHMPDVAVLCGADEDYPALLPQVQAVLPGTRLLVAGPPTDALRALAPAGFLHRKADLHAVLRGELDHVMRERTA